ncbi:MAG TPA: hypothetical protein VG937_11760 [Polyangiaceae bacterium]|jgi:predicted esterase|nr:hypothetical protein [Polyangiaceae bacterium]
MSVLRVRAFARLCALTCLAATLLVISPRVAASPAERAASSPRNDGEVVFYPPLDRSRPKPLFVMLHGMCGAPERTCPYFAATTERLGWLVCPRAARPCEGGGTTWSHREREQTIERAVARVRAQFPGEIDETAGRTLIGFSLGAFVATDLAQHPVAGAPYSRVLLIGARVFPDAAGLRQAGVERVVFAAGQYDMTYSHMAEQAKRLRRSGLPSRFIDLGRIGHAFPQDFREYLEQALLFLGFEATNLAAAS